MGKYRKTDGATTQGVCLRCNINKQEGRGGGKFAPLCSSCRKILYKDKYKYRLHKKDLCDRCGFIPEHPCQLDVDHIDGNHSNSEISNLQTLCANCHRLKTQMSKDTM